MKTSFKLCLTAIFAAAFISVTTALPTPVHTRVAFADSLYLRVITEDTPFYAEESEASLLFYLPYTYYVKVLGYGSAYTHVEIYGNAFAAIDGFVPNGALFSDGLEVKNPYPEITLTTARTCVLYADSALKNNVQYVFSARDMDYYGSLSVSKGETLYFVGYNGKLGYVKESDVLPFTIAAHPNELTFLAPDEPDEPKDNEEPAKPDEQTTSDETVKWIIIGCLGAAGVVALLTAFSKKRPEKKAAAGYYDENDFE